MRIIASITLLIAIVFGARAVPGVKLGYCSDMDAGYGDAGGVVTPWVSFPSELTEMYLGSSLTKVRIGLLCKANNVTIYLKHSPEDNEPFYSKKIGTLEAGWHEFEIEEPYLIKKGEDVAVGYKATFTKAGGAAYSQDQVVAEACRAFYNTKNSWIDVKGAFCIEAILEGEGLITDELGLLTLSEGVKDFFQDFTPLFVTVKNYGSNEVQNFSIGYSVDGGEMVLLDFEGPILSGQTREYELDVPEQGIGIHEVVVTVVNVNGVADSYTDNNTLATKITERDPAFIRRVVVEEGTGTWCGWCPRGIVGLDMMVERHPEQFIPIALHSGDQFVPEGYQKSLDKLTSLPGSYVDRRLTGDPYYDIENNFQKEVAQTCHVAYDIREASVVGNTLRVVSKVMVDSETPASQLNVAFTITEDGLYGKQNNSYSGSSEKMGGWEELPSVVPCEYMFVARGIYPSYDGICLLSGTLVPEEDYEFSYEFELPDHIANVNNISVIGQIIDSGNGFILNAKKTVPDLTGAASIAGYGREVSEVVMTEVFNLDGIRVYSSPGPCIMPSGLDKGLYIIITRYADGKSESARYMKTR